MFIIDSFVAGAGWLGNHLALLVVPKDEELSGKGQRPQMKLVEPHQESYNEISADVLSIRGFQEYSCNEYHLGENKTKKRASSVLNSMFMLNFQNVWLKRVSFLSLVRKMLF